MNLWYAFPYTQSHFSGFQYESHLRYIVHHLRKKRKFLSTITALSLSLSLKKAHLLHWNNVKRSFCRQKSPYIYIITHLGSFFFFTFLFDDEWLKSFLPLSHWSVSVYVLQYPTIPAIILTPLSQCSGISAWYLQQMAVWNRNSKLWMSYYGNFLLYTTKSKEINGWMNNTILFNHQTKCINFINTCISPLNNCTRWPVPNDCKSIFINLPNWTLQIYKSLFIDYLSIK